MVGYGLVRMERGQGRKLAPKVVHDRVALDLPLVEPMESVAMARERQ
jgi:predicted transcriptional regulator